MSRAFPQVEMEPTYGFFHYLSHIVYSMWFRGEVIGLENLPQNGPYLVASNHASHLDPPIVGSHLAQQVCFFARKTLWKPGIAAWWLDAVGTIPVDRDGGADVTAIKRVLGALKKQKVVILFPEGTRSPDGQLQTPKPGVGMLACRAQVPVIPVRIFGSFAAFGRTGGLNLGSPVSLVFGRPLAPADYDHPSDGKELRYPRAAERIMAKIAELQPPPVTVI
jgi:1-acyl-sn-glycerol-3-phosphate acyltransferase